MAQKGLRFKMLDLTGNNLTDEIFPELIQICKSVKLLNLNLEFNNIKDSGLKEFGTFLGTNPSLQSINLNRNQISGKSFSFFKTLETGLTNLLRDIKKNRTLKSISFYGNKINNKGGLYLAKVLKMNTTLVQVDVKNTDIDDDIIEVIDSIMKRNKGEIKSENVLALPEKYKELENTIEVHEEKQESKREFSVENSPKFSVSFERDELSEKSETYSQRDDLVSQVKYLKQRIRELEKKNYELETFVQTIKRSLGDINSLKKSL